MNNHEHLFVETPEANLSAGMQLLNGSYTSYFNRRHRRCGHLFQGRFKAHLVDEDGYYLEISRYIHLNPVRARLVEHPQDWPWSSYPGYRRARSQLDWLTYRRVLREFGRSQPQARRAYVRFIAAGMAERPRCPWAGAAGGLIVGGSAFVERIGKLLVDRPLEEELPQLEQIRPRPSLERIVAVVCRHFDVDASAWSPGRRYDDVARPAAAYLARHRFGYPAGVVAAALGYRGHSSVSAAVVRIESSPRGLKTAISTLASQLAND